MLQNLYNFLEASQHRHSKLESLMLELRSKPWIKSLKKLSDARWACRSDAIQAVYEKFTAIKKALKSKVRMAELLQMLVDLCFQ